MDRTLTFYEKNSFVEFRRSRENLGYPVVSVVPYIFNNSLIATQSPLEVVDISSLSEYNNKQSIAEHLFCQFDDYISFACDLAKWDILSYDLRYIFPLDGPPEEHLFSRDIGFSEETKLSKSRVLYFYDKDEFYDFEDFKEKDHVSIVSIRKFVSKPALISAFNPRYEIVDISAIKEYSKIQLIAEETIYQFPGDSIFICDRVHRELLEYDLRFIFKKFDNIRSNSLGWMEDDATDHVNPKFPSKTHKKIIDLDNFELTKFFKSFREKLYGHPKFKNDFEEQIRTFIMFNRLGEHKILSFFLMGESGVGKTEVARLIFDCMGGRQRLAKINFGNYSNEFSLSSLIGSARGYIGSEDGEIFMRVRDTDIGILLIDEFEKSNAALFNYFLDVLESGKMTSSLGQEIDLNGFIIVFTSNISKENFKKRISPELRSRFDYKCIFTPLGNSDKEKYLEFRARSISSKISPENEADMFDNLHQYLRASIDVSSYNNMRDINKQIKKVFVEYHSEARIIPEISNN